MGKAHQILPSPPEEKCAKMEFMQEFLGAVDMRPYSGQWIATSYSSGKVKKVKVVAAAPEYQPLIQKLESLGLDQNKVCISQVPKLMGATIL